MGAGALAALASCAAPQGGAGATTTVATLPAGADESARAGATVFASQCVACHGPHGKGDGPAARKMNADMPDLAEAAASDDDDELFNVVTNGFKPMPSFRDRLSERQRWDVVHYVRAAFAPAAAPPAAPAGARARAGT